jgi:hypothetical protein
VTLFSAHCFFLPLPFNLAGENGKKEMCFFQDGSQIIKEKKIYHHVKYSPVPGYGRFKQ